MTRPTHLDPDPLTVWDDPDFIAGMERARRDFEEGRVVPARDFLRYPRQKPAVSRAVLGWTLVSVAVVVLTAALLVRGMAG
jgi:hypothetical protein